MLHLIKRAKNYFEDSLAKYFNTIDMEYESYMDTMEGLEELLKLDDEILEKHFK